MLAEDEAGQRAARRKGGSRMAIDPEALTASLRRLAERGDDSGMLTVLNEVTEACVDLFAVTGSGIMVADEQDVTRYVAATDGPASALEQLESQLGEGPCTDAFIHGKPISSPDLSKDDRWPRLARAIEGYPVRAVMGVPIRLGGIPVGTLDVFRDTTRDWDDVERAALVRYGEIVGSTLASALAAHNAGELADQLQYALDYRVVIERGVGYLMARDGIDEVIAFNRLRRAARSSRSRIGDVAQHLLSTGQLPKREDG